MSKSSTTAAAVLRGVWLTACDPKTAHLVPTDGQPLSRAAMVHLFGRRRTHRFDSSASRTLLRWIEWVALPGICSHYAARKLAIARLCEVEPPRQLVVLGAGFDSLAWRWAARPGWRCIEIDHPATQSQKAAVLGSLPDRNVLLKPCDLSDIESIDHTFDALTDDPTLFIAEGLLMYLNRLAVERILSRIAARGDRAIVSFMDLDAAGRPAFAQRRGLVRRYLAWAREPFIWGIQPHHAASFIQSLGLQLDSLIGAAQAGVSIDVQPGMITGEWLAKMHGVLPR